MNATIRLEPWTIVGDRVELAATLSIAGASHRLWWRVPSAWRDALTTWADPFVIGFLFPIMRAGEDVEIVGAPVSPSLLANLDAFADIWHLWEPARYRRARIFGADEREPPAPADADAFVVPFSAGVDSSFTAFRHARGLAGRNARRLGAGITFFGFDIQASERNAGARYAQLRDGARAMLDSVGVPSIELDGNFRTLPQFWQHSHGAQLAAGLALFGGRFGGGLIANSTVADRLDRPGHRLGSHPLTDPLFSSARFPIFDDGAAFNRIEKITAIRDWAEANAHLRVCFGAAGNVGNCGRCEKCFRTAIAYRIVGGEPPAGLPRDLAPRAMRHLRAEVGKSTRAWRDLEAAINARGQHAEPWAAGVRGVLARGARASFAKRIKKPFVPVRNVIRSLLRGSPLSRSQRAAMEAARTRS